MHMVPYPARKPDGGGGGGGVSALTELVALFASTCANFLERKPRCSSACSTHAMKCSACCPRRRGAQAALTLCLLHTLEAELIFWPAARVSGDAHRRLGSSAVLRL